MHRSARILALSTAVIMTAVFGCKKSDAPAKPKAGSIIFISIDTLRADHLSLYGYLRNTSPRLDAFAKRAIVFDNAVTPMATTLPAHTSMFTGTRPLRHGIVENGLVFEPEPGLDLIAQKLKRAGYRTAAFVSAPPVAKGTGIEKGFDEFNEPENTQLAQVTTDKALAWLKKSGDEPFFLWVHYWDPHDPYEPPAPYDKKFKKTESQTEFIKESGAPLIKKIGNITFDVLDINNRYDGEIAYTDEHIGRLIEGLEKRNQLDELTLVIAGDHGEGLWQHNWHDHGRIFNEQLFVPLIIKPAKRFNIAPKRVERMASTIDIFPTLGPLLGLPLSKEDYAQFEGIDLFDESKLRPYVFSERVNRHRETWETGDKYSLTGLDWKYFALTDGKDQLYDMKTDRLELTNVIDQHPEVALRLKRQMQAVMSSYLGRKKKERNRVNPALVEKLKALGYIQ